jgi:osmotically-inducible protein OsmY
LSQKGVAYEIHVFHFQSENVAKGVQGIREVENNIVVDYKEARPDLEIKADVEKALRWDALVDHALIDVEVKDGKVSLAGVVGSAAEKSHAVMSEKEIHDAIQHAFLYDPRVMSCNVQPEVTGDTVTLRGTVNSLKARRAASLANVGVPGGAQEIITSAGIKKRL